MPNTYNRTKASMYAQKWALGANPAFFHFGGVGGDCTNFVSQCLLAGGAKMDYSFDGWFYNSSIDRSPSWTAVESLSKYLLSGRGALFSTKRDIQLLQVGDIIQLRQNKYRFNHTVIVSRKYGKKIYVCAHSNDALDKDFEEYSFLEAVGLHIEID